MRRTASWIGGVLLVLIAVAFFLFTERDRTPAGQALPAAAAGAASAAEAHAVAYVDNKLCLNCHQAQADAWRGSHHALAMALPTAQTVRGNFDDSRFTHQGHTTRFFRRDGAYFVNTEGADGKPADFQVKYTFGIEPLQQYLIETEPGRLQALTIAWDTRDKKWFHLLPGEKTPPGDVLHWTGRYQTANTMCISCHTTNFEKRYDAAADRFDSRWSAIDVSCQSCHGPGQQHVDWAQAAARGGKPAAMPHHGLVVDTRGASAQQTVQLCASCHSRRSELTASFSPGLPQFDQFLPSLLREGLYYPDGQQLDEVYVDGSFRQSKMYAAGVSCTNCHDPHAARLKLQGNALCLQCHSTTGNAAFAKAAGNYDSPEHHHHATGSSGAQCVACHMPAKNYMQIQARPDHSLRVPRPDLSVKLGTPNACSNCHDDKSAQWAAQAIERWFGKRQWPVHYGEVFAAMRNGEPDAAAAVVALAADKSPPAIVRATALDMLRQLPDSGLDVRIAATHDSDAEVRATAAAGLEVLPAAQRVPSLAPLLHDPVRAVRIAAARALSSLPIDQFDAPTRAAFDAALAEYIAAQNVSLDMPGANLNLAVLYENLGRTDLAEQHYLRALKIDPDFTPARANLSRLYASHSRNADAEKVLREGVQRQPGLGELQYSLGLLLAEEKRLPEAAKALQQAARLMPERARVQYNLGLAMQQLGQAQAAESALLAAQRLDPADAAYPYALAVLYAQGGQRGKALAAAQRLLSLRPDDPQVQRLVAQLSSATR